MIGAIVGWLAQSAKRQEAEKKLKEDTERLRGLQGELLNLINAGYGLDVIAELFEQQHSIQPTQTLLIAASFIDHLAQHDDPKASELAQAITARQRVDSATPPDQFVNRLNEQKTIFMSGRCFGAWSGSKNIYKEGIFVLSTAYIYFFTNIDTFSYAAARAKGLAGGVMEAAIPGWGIVSTIFEVGAGAVEGSESYFSQSRLVHLAEALKKGDGFAVPLTAIQGYTLQKSGSSTLAIIEARRDTETAASPFWLAPKPLAKPQWGTVLTDILRLACIAEGRLLIVKRPAKS